MGYLKFQSTHFHCVYFYLDRWICILSFARYDYLQVVSHLIAATKKNTPMFPAQLRQLVILLVTALHLANSRGSVFYS